jgi:hypothetical protein
MINEGPIIITIKYPGDTKPEMFILHDRWQLVAGATLRKAGT